MLSGIQRNCLTLNNWPSNTSINWSKVAREHGVLGSNSGQVVKEFAQKKGVDISRLEACTPKRKPPSRPSKKRLPGCDVSVPSNPSLKSIENEINSMISSGRFTLGDECAPYKVTKFTPSNGRMIARDVLVYGRKVPLEQIRKRLLKKQEQYMRIANDTTACNLVHPLHTETSVCSADNSLQAPTHSYQQSRSLAMWHDHATILGSGFVLITVHTLYDDAVFLTNEEYKEVSGKDGVDVQAEVEQPEIYLLSRGSSSVEDQAALVGDRLDCLIHLNDPVVASNGTEIHDTLRLFTGDHPAAQFEQGTQQGGTYKCGACGCQDVMFSDQAHALQCYWRSLEEIQMLAVGGKYGCQPGATKPFDKLRVTELREELKARGVFDLDRLKPQLQRELTEILKGVQRVSAMALGNPKQDLHSINLTKYEVVACA